MLFSSQLSGFIALGATLDLARATPAVAAINLSGLTRGQLAAAGFPSDAMRILYGGSVKADSAAALFALSEVDGGLVGGASLDAEAFAGICRHAAQHARTSA